MKFKLKLVSALFISVMALFNSSSNAQDIQPTFNMTVKNIHTLNPTTIGQDSVLLFEVWMQQTNQGLSNVMDFEYCCGQFTWSYNREVQSTGNLTFGIVGAQSSLPPSLRPPSFQVDSVNGYLKMSGNLPQSLANYFISGQFPGTKILTAKLVTSLPCFPIVPVNLRFKLGASPNTFVAAFAPYPDSVDSEQFPSQFAIALMDTVQNIYSVENGGYVYPVELLSFASSIDKNNVNLNWTTSSELNNQGFEIERTLVGSDEWTKSGYVSGNGTTSETHTYNFSENLPTGKFNYRLKQIDFNGSISYHSLNNEVVVGIPSAFSISQNYPNPFNPATKIDFELPTDGNVSVILYDISGREIMKLVNENRAAGYYTVQMNASNLSSGMYFYRISSGSFSDTKKMVVLK